jgi:hypothetical protein
VHAGAAQRVAKNNADEHTEAASRADASATTALEVANKAWEIASTNPNRSDVYGFESIKDDGIDRGSTTQVGANVTLVLLEDGGAYEVYGKKYPVHCSALFRSPNCNNIIMAPKKHKDVVDGKVVVRRMTISPRSVFMFTSVKREQLMGVVCGKWLNIIGSVCHLLLCIGATSVATPLNSFLMPWQVTMGGFKSMCTITIWVVSNQCVP